MTSPGGPRRRRHSGSARSRRTDGQKGSIMRCEQLDNLAQGRLVSPSAERNKGPIADVLKRVLPERGLVLEVSSGTGQHVVHFAREMPHLDWQPTERDAACLQSITHGVAAEALPNIRAALRLDVGEQAWLVGFSVAVVWLYYIDRVVWRGVEGD